MEDCTLKNLKCTLKDSKQPLPLTPPFSKTTQLYSLIVPPVTSSLSITASPSQSDAFSQIKAQDSDGLVKIQVGSNEVIIRVEAADGTSSSVYMINVYRPAGIYLLVDASENDTSLRDMEVTGVLDPKIDPREMNYTLDVGLQMTTSIKPVPMNPSAIVVVTPSHLNLDLNLGNTPVSISVSTGGAQSKYSVLVTRTSPTMRLVGEGLKCVICTSVAFKPHSYPCKHSVCGACVMIFSRTDDSCAFCQTIGVSYDLEKKYAESKLACGSCKEGMSPRQLESHECSAYQRHQSSTSAYHGRSRMQVEIHRRLIN
jgi:hypothetical protein